jgi:hypothetical protein
MNKYCPDCGKGTDSNPLRSPQSNYQCTNPSCPSCYTMKAKDIHISGRYIAKVSGKLTTVKVIDIRNVTKTAHFTDGARDATVYDVVNEATGRRTTFRSATKFRGVARTNSTLGAMGRTNSQAEEHARLEAEDSMVVGGVECNTPEAEECSDPTPVAVVCGPTTTERTNVAPVATNGLATRLAEHLNHAKPAGLTPTPEQEAIIAITAEVQANGGGVVMVEAGAGTGKTSSFRMLVDTLQGNGQYTAFNRPLVDSSRSKFAGTHCECQTTHQLAFRAIGKQFAHRLDSHRVRSEQIAKMLGLGPWQIGESDSAKRMAPGWLAGQVMQAVRKFCQSADPEVQATHFRYADGLDMPTEDGRRTYVNNEKLRDHLLPYARKAWADLSDPEGQLPFSHDHYVKAWQLNKPVIAADYILLDEAQDTSPVMMDIIRQQVDGVANPPLVVIVGDSAQQIYEWRGAINALAAFPEAPRKFLSQSFRFGQAVADVANRVLETLEEPTQLRLKGLPSIPSRVEALEQPGAILTRTNALAVATLLSALNDGRKACLVGKIDDIRSFLEAARTLQQGQPTSHPDLACFETWGHVQAYVKEDEGEDLKLLVKLIDSFGVDVILDALNRMPAEKDADLVISTAHKSKGREWDHVQLAADFPTCSKSTDADRKLLYVAVTRAKLTLDITQCPFFTGNDKLDVSDVIGGYSKEPRSILAPTPATAPAPTSYTWSKKGDNWLVRGPAGNQGKQVTVERRDGSKSICTLLEAVETYGETSVYRIRR